MAENKLEEALKKFIETKDQHDFAAMMDIMENSVVLLPAMPPKILTAEAQAAIKAGRPVPVDQNNQPQVCLFANADGKKIFPIFTSKDHIPKEKQPPVIMNAPFRAVVAMVRSNPDVVKDAVVNPFTQGVVLNEKLMELADIRFKKMDEIKKAGQNGAQTVQLTEAQYHAVMHTKVSREILTEMFFNDSEGALSDIRINKEKFVVNAYKKAYGNDLVCPYTEDDLAVMMLQLEEDLLLIRIDMPEANMVFGGPLRIYITCEENHNIRYFIVEKTAKDNPEKIAEVSRTGDYNVIIESPDNGAEIETIVSLIRPS